MHATPAGGSQPKACWDKRDLRFGGAAGGRDEETYSRYATGIQVKQYPSWRQDKPAGRGGVLETSTSIFTQRSGGVLETSTSILMRYGERVFGFDVLPLHNALAEERKSVEKVTGELVTHEIAESLENTLHEQITCPVNVTVHIEPDIPALRK